MTKSKSTKRALLSSALALVLCFSMLVGSTFAWFTDTVTSAGNKIVAGTLDVDLLMADATGKYESIAGKDAAIFGEGSLAQDNAQETLWEPGKTQIVYLAVENKGNLDLKYNIALNVVDGGLIGSLEYAIIDGAQYGDLDTYTDWATLKADAQTGDVVAGTTVAAPNGAIKAGEDAVDYFALAVHMKEEAGNDYQGKDITIDVTVLATQLASEYDSFDNQYDANLEPSNNGISRVLEDGSTAFYYDEESGFGGRVRLTALPENLGNEYVVPAEINDLGGALAGVTLDKLTVSAGVQYAYKSLEGATIDEVVIEDGATTVPNRMFYKAKVGSVEIPDSVTVIEQYAFSQAQPKTLVIPASVTTVEECAFAYMPNLETVIVEGDITLTTYAFRACPKLATVVIKGNVTVATANMVFSNYEAGGKDDMSFYVNSQENANALIPSLGAYNDTITGANRNKWTVNVCEKIFVDIKSADELQAALADGGYVVLTKDIDLTGVEWTPVGTAEAPYSGTFDGNGHTISGLTITSGNYAGLFGYVSGATIKNVTLSDVSVSGGERMGALVGQINGNAVTVVENCTVSGSVAGSDSNTGGLIGEIINGTVQLTNLTNNATVSNTKSSNSRAGGIVGQVTTGANVTLKDCVNNGDIYTNNGYAGGIVSAYQSGTLTIENCVNNGDLEGQYEGNMLGWYTTVQSITISSESNEFDLNAIGCVDIATTSNMSLYGKNYFVNKKASLTGVTDTKQTFSEIFAADKIGTSPKALWDKLIAFYAHAAETNNNFAGYPDTYWKMFNKSVGYSEPDWNSYFESYNAQCGDGNKLEKSEFSSASWREHIVYLAPEA